MRRNRSKAAVGGEWGEFRRCARHRTGAPGAAAGIWLEKQRVARAGPGPRKEASRDRGSRYDAARFKAPEED
jgi:hypothetical protein